MTSYTSKKHLNRRTFLRGVGAGLALPLLDAMVPARASAAAVKTVAPTRLGFVYVPNGVIMEGWTPAADGKAYELSPILETLAPHRDEFLVASGLAQNNARALGDGGGDHARASAVFLTGVHPNKTDGADLRAGVSVDQIAADHLGRQSRFPSLELTLETGRLAGNCDSGYSCAYSNTISWRTETTPNPPEGNPRAVFDRLFGGKGQGLDAAARERRQAYRGSILDLVMEDARSLQRNLGPTDRRKLDEYLYGIRLVEKQVASGEELDSITTDTLEVPEKKPRDYAEYARLMYDLQVLAFQTDQTRVITFMMGREGSGRAYREVGVRGGHHGLSHHLGDEAKIADLRKINHYHVEQFAYFIDRMKSVEDGEGSLLDHSLIVYGSGIGDGNRHSHNDLPVLIAGRAGGHVTPGRHVRFDKDTPMNNLYLNMLEYAGCPTDNLGDSDGRLNYLSSIKA
jgi:hypothetical protein